MEVIAAIDKVMEEVAREFPHGTRLVDLFSTKDFLQASMQQVVKTLAEAFVLVVLIVLLFLQSGRATLIPTISILVSLISTFAVMYLIGFTLNLLTLFALVLAIGIEVDDAIIVVEAVQARFEDGYKSTFMATADAMGGITSAIIATTLVFMGGVRSRGGHGRGLRRLLPAIRHHHGYSHGAFRGERPHPCPSPLRADPETGYGG